MNQPHKNAQIICKWVNGANIQFYSENEGAWFDVPNVNNLDEGNNYLTPNPLHPDYDGTEYRVKE